MAERGAAGPAGCVCLCGRGCVGACAGAPLLLLPRMVWRGSAPQGPAPVGCVCAACPWGSVGSVCGLAWQAELALTLPSPPRAPLCRQHSRSHLAALAFAESQSVPSGKGPTGIVGLLVVQESHCEHCPNAAWAPAGSVLSHRRAAVAVGLPCSRPCTAVPVPVLSMSFSRGMVTVTSVHRRHIGSAAWLSFLHCSYVSAALSLLPPGTAPLGSHRSRVASGNVPAVALL